MLSVPKNLHKSNSFEVSFSVTFVRNFVFTTRRLVSGLVISRLLEEVFLFIHALVRPF